MLVKPLLPGWPTRCPRLSLRAKVHLQVELELERENLRVQLPELCAATILMGAEVWCSPLGGRERVTRRVLGASI